MKIAQSIIIAILLALTISITPVMASIPLDVSIVSEMWLNAEDPNAPMAGSFVAMGPAVDTGLICPAGSVVDISNPAIGWQSGVIIKLPVHKHFYCEDGTGSFEMNMNVLLFTDPWRDNGQWIIVSGDGLYGSIFGNGKLTGSWADSGALIDTYTGRIH